MSGPGSSITITLAPRPPAPIVNRDGSATPEFWRFLVNLFNQTAAGAPVTSADLESLQFTARPPASPERTARALGEQIETAGSAAGEIARIRRTVRDMAALVQTARPPTLPVLNPPAGTYGSATQSAVLTIDAYGRVRAASQVPITGGGGSGGAYIPLVTGAEPPVFVTDGAGVLITVAYAP